MNIRFRKLIPKDKLFEVLNEPDVNKVLLVKSNNKTLTNEELVSVYIWVKIPKGSLNTILGCCYKESKTMSDLSDKGFLAGVYSSANYGFLSYSDFTKIIEISKKYSLNLGILKTLPEYLENWSNKSYLI